VLLLEGANVPAFFAIVFVFNYLQPYLHFFILPPLFIFPAFIFAPAILSAAVGLGFLSTPALTLSIPNDPPSLNFFLVTEISPDFVIDDGSHRYSDIMSTFIFLYPLLKKGAYYFIEDLHASYAHREKVMNDIGEMTEFIMECNDKLLIVKK